LDLVVAAHSRFAARGNDRFTHGGNDSFWSFGWLRREAIQRPEYPSMSWPLVTLVIKAGEHNHVNSVA
jgi:hypothetical protein